MATTKRIRRRPEDAEREILDAAEALLKETQFRDLTVDAVTSAANMKRSNFYNYFRDRNELVIGLVDRIAGEMFAETRGWLEDEEPDRIAAVRQGLLSVVTVWARHADVLAAMAEAAHHDEAAQLYFREGVLQDYIDQVAAVLRREKRQGLTAVSDPAEVSRALNLLNVSYMTERIRSGARPEEVAAVMAEIWIATLYPGRD